MNPSRDLFLQGQRDHLAARQTGSARDLGAPGLEEIYGHGLVPAAPPFILCA
jgi:hypothetical protein